MNKSQYFRKPTAKEITKGKSALEADSNLINAIESLKEDQFLRIKRELHSFEKPKKFIRHAPDLKIVMPSTIREHIEARKTPVIYRLETMKDIKDPYYACYSHVPLRTNDRTTRRISLVNCVDGAQLYAYMQNNSAGAKVLDFDESLKAEKEGAQVIVSIPSRTPKQSNHKIKFISFPVTDNENKYAIAYSLRTEGHDCMDKLITNTSFNLPYFKKDSHFVSFCDHEIAAYLHLIDYFHNEKKNVTPYQMSLFAIPTNKIIELKKDLENKVVIEKPNKEGLLMDYPLTESEKELFYWAAVNKYGPEKTFYRKNTKDGLLKDAHF
ncbi:MAG: hypothetical protein KJ623_03585 [Nanoarchaeota archaeon]|nr:hypothetical protein [Nanoarchaeota archaeon]